MFASGGCRGRGIRGGFRGLFFGLHARLLRRYELRDVDGGLVVELFFFLPRFSAEPRMHGPRRVPNFGL